MSASVALKKFSFKFRIDLLILCTEKSITFECIDKLKCSYSLGSPTYENMHIWTNLCNRKYSYTAGKDYMQVWKNLCNRKYAYALER